MDAERKDAVIMDAERKDAVIMDAEREEKVSDDDDDELVSDHDDDLSFDSSQDGWLEYMEARMLGKVRVKKENMDVVGRLTILEALVEHILEGREMNEIVRKNCEKELVDEILKVLKRRRNQEDCDSLIRSREEKDLEIRFECWFATMMRRSSPKFWETRTSVWDGITSMVKLLEDELEYMVRNFGPRHNLFKKFMIEKEELTREMMKELHALLRFETDKAKEDEIIAKYEILEETKRKEFLTQFVCAIVDDARSLSSLS